MVSAPNAKKSGFALPPTSSRRPFYGQVAVDFERLTDCGNLTSGWAKARSLWPIRSEVVAGVEDLLGKCKVLLGPWHARNLLGHLQALIRRRGEELTQNGLIPRR
jgi:hypothetical protein